jgi:uncharacterized membrane protein
MKYAFAALVLGLAIGSSAQAGLTVCNKTAAEYSVAVGYKDNGDWSSFGWWNVAAGDCKTIVGGDLKNRYYYYRAVSEGNLFRSDDIYFCTDPGKFTIVGDTECVARGYDKNAFAKVDTGADAKDFTLSLLPAEGAQTDEATSGVAPGTYGEFYTTRGLLQGCEIEDGYQSCQIFADGIMLYVSYDDRTPENVIRMMEELPVNTPVEIGADVVNVYDSGAEVVIHRLKHNTFVDKFAWIRVQLQGSWVADKSDSGERYFVGSREYTYHEGDLVSDSYFDVGSHCDDSNGQGPVLTVVERQYMHDEEPLCYIISYVDADTLELTYMPRGNTLYFKRE